MPTISIYVPDALKAKMDGFGKVNWSRITQDGIRAEIMRNRATQGSMTAVSDRIQKDGSRRGRPKKIPA